MKNLLLCLLSVAAIAAPATGQTVSPSPLTCLLAPNLTSDLGSDRGGIVIDVPVSRADIVAKGDVLVQLDAQRIVAELRISEITIAAMTAQIARSEQLSRRNLIPADELAQMRTELALAEAQADQTRYELDRSSIRAPFAGVVIAVDVAPGELISSAPLMRLVDISTLKAEMIFLDDAFGKISAGAQVELAIDLIGATVIGQVTAIDPLLDAASNSFSVSAIIENSDLAIPAGVSCRVVGWR